MLLQLQKTKIKRSKLSSRPLLVWGNREQLDLEKSFRSYIVQIVNHLSIDYLRKIAKEGH